MIREPQVSHLREALLDMRLSGDTLAGCLHKVLRRDRCAIPSDAEIQDWVQTYLGPTLGPIELTATTQALSFLDASHAHRLQALPLRYVDAEFPILHFAVRDPSWLEQIAELQLLTGHRVQLFRAEPADLRQALSKHYRNEQTQHSDAAQAHRSLASAASPAIQVVEDVLREAQRTQCSDIHIEPNEQGLVIRLRQDGALRVYRMLPARNRDEVIARVKVLATMDLAERRRPQDGRIQWTGPAGRIDLRVSTLPTNHGEKVVMRLLDQSSVALDLASLGFLPDQLEIMERYIYQPYGMILITGPTGSGKTTTLYATLTKIRRPELNISTIEDPVEYRLEGINQTQVHSKIGLGFAEALRTLLRQDPNVLLVGEIRDADTAQLAIRAALTGHLVYSTLHTNDAPSALTRLVDIGIEPFLVASSVSLIVAQRLVRRSCEHCLEPAMPQDPSVLQAFGLDPHTTLPQSRGCSHCDYTGFSGRLAIYEIMPITQELRDALQDQLDASRLRDLALTSGMMSLRQDGLRKAQMGWTTLAEVLREALH
jgi:type II secretory ATPase GspE/PulE/Tfp pilus assembly ATPase PilB-like protein